MRTRDHLQVVGMVELLGDILTKSVPGTPRIHPPSSTVIRIRPKQIAHRSLMRHLLESFERADVIEGLDAGRESSVEAEKLIFDDGSERQVVEKLSKALPDV
jgi:hypothetical protein